MSCGRLQGADRLEAADHRSRDEHQKWADGINTANPTNFRLTLLAALHSVSQLIIGLHIMKSAGSVGPRGVSLIESTMVVTSSASVP